MIQIDDEDLPITAAQKLITGTRKRKPTPVQEALQQYLGPAGACCEEQDQFDDDDLKEIAEHLLIYLKTASGQMTGEGGSNG